jgi:hypothetical protein
MTRMTLRWRVAVALVAVVVPIALGFTFFSYRLRRETLLEGTYDAVLARMESGGRERCEARETFDARPGRHEGRRARRLARRAVELVARYDASLVSGDPHAPSLDPSIGEAFASGEVAVLDPTSPRGIPRVALRMPWDEGPCAVVLVPAPRAILAGGFARDLVILLGVLALAPRRRDLRAGSAPSAARSLVEGGGGLRGQGRRGARRSRRGARSG